MKQTPYNNRFDYICVDELGRIEMRKIREEYINLYNKLLLLPSCRELSIALTDLERSLMWASKSIAIQYEIKEQVIGEIANV